MPNEAKFSVAGQTYTINMISLFQNIKDEQVVWKSKFAGTAFATQRKLAWVRVLERTDSTQFLDLHKSSIKLKIVDECRKKYKNIRDHLKRMVKDGKDAEGHCLWKVAQFLFDENNNSTASQLLPAEQEREEEQQAAVAADFNNLSSSLLLSPNKDDINDTLSLKYYMGNIKKLLEENVRRQQQRAEELERREQAAARASDSGPVLKWQTN